MATNLSPEILALLAQWQQGQAPVQAGGYTYQPNWGMTEGPNGAPMPDYFGGVKSWDRTSGDFRKGGAAEQFAPDGTFSHNWQATGETPFLRDLAIWAAMAGGVNGIGEILSAQAAAGGAGLGSGASYGGASSAENSFLQNAMAGGGDGAVPSLAGSAGQDAITGGGLSSADKAAMFGNSGYGTGMSGAATGAFDSTLGMTGSTSLANLAGNAADAASGLPWKTIGQLGMGVLGALDSRDKQNNTSTSSTREPWAAAQPLLQSLLGQGQQLQQQYAAQPFTPQQQTAYNNFGSLLNSINGGAQGLLGGASANASGANNFDRSNPRKALTGSSFNLSQFAPGLLQFFKPQGGP